jgi:uncharacterized protein YjbI with pentapeptide repeats
MANQEQLTLLKQGAKIWNEWRSQQYSGTDIDLRGTDLERADLSNANLTRASLNEVISNPVNY